ncbi:MAG TPA: CRISPR-associated endonuclease Cas1 [Steroidobacteraceae bacterium]|nr:CRISPR-associated endonuclease Cas1 [Steroidobacteraceae bacterium]
MKASTSSSGSISPIWCDRSAFWLSETASQSSRRLREREQRPLILTGHGLALRVDKGSLYVRDGNTHHPAQRREWRFFNAALDIPPAFLVIDGSGSITLDAIDWLARHRVPLIRVRWDGQFGSIVTSGGQAASASKVHWQQRTRDNPCARLAFAVDLIREKATNTLTTLEEHLPRSALWERAYKNIENRAKSLKERPPRTFASLLGIEGSIAGDYFRVWSGLPIRWRPLKRHPIPADWHAYRSRVALRHGIVLRKDGGGYNRGATHPVNAMLNYAYAVLIAQTQVRLIAEGFDPTLGVMHEKKALRGMNPGFALDHMEPMRPVVDRAVLQLIAEATFTGADFSIQHDGVCRMNPELARRVAQLTLERCGGSEEWASRCS